MNSQADLVEQIVHEVKSQGVFDQFRKDLIADVDTKPAYQNLRQRVSGAVEKFLSNQKWTPEMNKNQLREKLRRHIADSGFLEVGVERIVDQVLNPKIHTVFRPKIEEIAYKYLGVPPPRVKIEPPPPPILPPLPPLPMTEPALNVKTSSGLLPNDLEQISPDSDRATVKSENKDELTDMDIDEKMDEDDESPPFEPLAKACSPVKSEPDEKDASQAETIAVPVTAKCIETPQNLEDSASQSDAKEKNLKVEETLMSVDNTEQYYDKEASPSRDVDASGFQDSQLSQVSSNSRISSGSLNSPSKSLESKSVTLENVTVNISEEAQMPKFSENSSEANNPNVEKKTELHFDINKDEIKFEGTERKSDLLPASDRSEFEEENRSNGNLAATELIEKQKGHDETGDQSFKFGNFGMKQNVSPAMQENSIPSSLDDTLSGQLCIAEGSKSEPISNLEPKSESLKSIDNLPSMPSPVSEPNKSINRHSLSSQHKKHSRDSKQRYRDKDASSKSKANDRSREREKSKEGESSRDKDKDRHSRRKHSSSSSKHSSSRKDSSERRSEKNPKHLSSSSSSSLRSEKRDSHRKHSHSNSQTGKETVNGSSSKRNDKKSNSTVDDHGEKKEKLYRRKSTDSNDEDKCPGGAKEKSENRSVQGSSASSKTKSNSKDTKTDSSSSHNGKHCKADENQNIQQKHGNVVILNDILENPSTNYIRLEINAHQSNQVQVITNPNVIPPNASSLNNSDNNCEIDNLLYFEESKNLQDNLKAIEKVLNGCKRIKDNFEVNSDTLNRSPSRNNLMCAKRAILHIDCMRYSSSGGEGDGDGDDGSSDGFHNDRTDAIHFSPPAKLSKLLKTSPTPSDGSVNSKENEVIEKNAYITKKTAGSEQHRKSSMIKLCQQQRYDSADLYKPRPVLSQRSRRRGVDAIL